MEKKKVFVMPLKKGETRKGKCIGRTVTTLSPIESKMYQSGKPWERASSRTVTIRLHYGAARKSEYVRNGRVL